MKKILHLVGYSALTACAVIYLFDFILLNFGYDEVCMLEPVRWIRITELVIIFLAVAFGLLIEYDYIKDKYGNN